MAPETSGATVNNATLKNSYRNRQARSNRSQENRFKINGDKFESHLEPRSEGHIEGNSIIGTSELGYIELGPK